MVSLFCEGEGCCQEKRRGDEQVINCLRSLAMDAVQQANSGHPGTPMAMAPVAYALWARTCCSSSFLQNPCCLHFSWKPSPALPDKMRPERFELPTF